MPTYAIGDVQGCYDPLRRLLDAIAFDPARDRLWFVGDLVNRGPQSLQVLRFAKSLGERAVTVLGNHDLHLLVVAAGVRKPHRGDTLDQILAAPDRDELLTWLRHRNLMHAGNGWAMVHGGLLPQWTVEQALALAREVEHALRGESYHDFLRHMYGNEPSRWRDDLSGHDRLRAITNAMTRLRLCTADGTMEFSHKTGPENMPSGFMPWYDVPERASRGTALVTGHWAALGLVVRPDLLALDTGCVWGRRLTALRLEDRRIFQCDCSGMTGTASEE
ncbi:MAG TPA: symmetrical bis(5'-nucleosyl)-tetraphosphatase [Burkholderiales bacterium]|nr:symmetrical bis(5'-nucleosyl)-tetraphosphatase [Burkholderiales bacterium]